VRRGCRQLGRIIRQMRKEKGLTLLELASVSGLSVSFLSQVEKGKAEPSFSSLLKVAGGLGVPLLRLLLACEGERTSSVVRPGDRIIVRWPRLNVDLELLSAIDRRVNLQAALIRLPAGSRSCDRELAHGYGSAEEFTYVLSGRVRLFLGGDVVELEQGDSVHFFSVIPHMYANPGCEEAVMLTVVSPPLF